MRPLVIFAPLLVVAACVAQQPTSPTLQVFNKGKSAEAFAEDNAVCKQVAAHQTRQDRYNTAFTECIIARNDLPQ